MLGPIFLDGTRNCPSITIVRARWYLDITRSAEAPANRVSVNVWWWSTLINQRRLAGRLPGCKEQPGRHLERRVVSLQCLWFPSERKREKDNQHFISFSDWLPLRGRKQVPGVQKATAIWMRLAPADPVELLLYENLRKVSFTIAVFRQRGHEGWGWGGVLWSCCTF